MPRYIFNPATRYKQTEGGGATVAVINSTEVNIANTPSIDLGFIRKNTTDVANGVAGLDSSAKLIANLDWNKINSGKPTTLAGYGIGDAVNRNTINAANGVAGLDANAKLNVDMDWSHVTSGKPTTLAGYGINDAVNHNSINAANGVAGLDANAKLNVDMDWSHVTSGKPTTLAGYGIGDAVNRNTINAANGVAGLDANAKLNVDMDWSHVTTGKPTTLAGYGISDAINHNSINVANGVAGLDGNGKLGSTVLPVGSGTTITGPISVSVGQVAEYKIVPYSTFNNYIVSAVGGTFTQLDDTIVFTVTANVGDTASITVNGAVYPLTVAASGITKPTVISPSNNSTNVSLTPTFNSSQFVYTGIAQTQDMVRWELSTSSNFITTVQYYEGSSNLTSWIPTALLLNTNYYVRVKHHSALSGWSSWSNVVAFSTLAGNVMTGPTTVYPNQVVDYTITGYVASGVYNIEVVGGTYTRSNGTITFTVTAGAGETASITLNGQLYPLTVAASGVVTPTITSPANNATNTALTPTFTSSAFAYLGTAQTQTRVNWELATSNGFGATVVQTYEGVNNLTSWTPTALLFNTNYYIRVKHFSAIGGWSEWSPVTSFTTMAGTGLTGSTTVYTNQVATFTIADYVSDGVYNISAVGGTIERVGANVSFTVTASAGGSASITFNGQLYTLTVLASGVATPSITSHSNNATDVSLTPSFTSSQFIYVGVTQTQDTVRWELATDSGFTSVVQFYEGPSNLTGWSPTTNLLVNLTYYLRVKYRSNIGAWSEWSPVVRFNTIVDSNITGPSTVYTGQVVTYTINGYSSSATYNINVVGGTYTHSNGTITFTVTASASGIANITVNGTTRTLTVEASTITTPSITSHSNNATNVSLTPNFTSSAFAFSGATQTQDTVRWEIATDASFSSVVQFYEGSSNLNNWTPTMLSFNTDYYVRVRYHSAISSWSAWSSVISFHTVPGTAMTGPSTVYTGAMSVYQITGYISGANYVISTVGGTYVRTTDGLVFTTTANAGGTASITLNGQVYPLTVLASAVVTPTITSPANNATDIAISPTFTGSVFAYVGVTQTQDSVRWELATDSGFTADLQYYEGASNLTSWTPTALNMSQSYFVRVKYHSASGGWSEWSPVIGFTTIVNSSVIGPSTVYTDQVVTYTIGNYNASTTYTITVQGGTFTRSGDTITYTVTTTPTGTASITVNGITRTLTVLASSVVTPSITTPSNGSTNVSISPTFTGSTFAYVGAPQTQNIVRWEIATNSTFTTGLQYYEGSSNLTSWTPSNALSLNTVYYVRVKYHSALGGWSNWSTTSSITTAADSSITGPSTVYSGQVVTYTINNYSGSATYTISVVGGTYTRSNDVITFTVTANGGSTASITINGSTTNITVLASGVTTPSITTPTNNAVDIPLTPTFISSAFAYVGVTQTQDSVRWELATDASFNTTVQFYEGNSNYTSWMPTALSMNLTYHVRVKYHSALGGWSAWSNVVSFSTVVDSNITGPSTVYTGQVVTYTINGYSSSATYTISVVGGTYTRSGADISFTVTASSGTVSITVNGTTRTLTLGTSTITTPSITSHSNNATDVSITPTFTSSAFAYVGVTQTQDSVEWQLATNVGFTTGLQSYSGTSNLVSWTPTTNLIGNTVYYVRVRHHSAVVGWSDWSTVISFTTVVTLTVTGPDTVYTNTPVDYTIGNYNASGTYTVTSVGGTTSFIDSGGVITFTPGNTAQNGSITVNGVTKSFSIVVSSVATPSIISPANNAVNVSMIPVFTRTPVITIGVQQVVSHVNLQISDDINFTNIVEDFVYGGPNIDFQLYTSLDKTLDSNATYYVKIRYEGSITGWSEWSTIVKFTTTNPTGISLSNVAILNGRYKAENGQIVTGTIINYNSSITYSIIGITPHISNISVTQNSFTFTILQSSNSVFHYAVNGTLYEIDITDLTIAKPSIITPSSGSNNVTLRPTFQGSAFSSTNTSQTHLSSDWELHKYSDGQLVASSYNDTSNLISWTPTITLLENTTYYVSVKYRGSLNKQSNWSEDLIFTTAVDNGWVARLDGRLTYETFYDSTVDSLGNTYTVGRDAKTNSGGYIADSALIAKWSPTGSLVWMYRLASTTEHSIFYGITCDASDNIYAVGTLNIGSGFVGEGLITKWTTSGTLVWQKTVSAVGGETYNGVTADTTGNIYAVGYANVTQTSNGGRPIVTKLNSSGALSWHRIIYWGSDAYFSKATCDSNNDLLVVGRFGANVSLTYTYIALLKIDSNGDGIVWSYIKGGSGYSGSFTNIKVSTSNFIYVSGSEATANVIGCVLSKLQPWGAPVWEKRLDGTIGGWLGDEFLDLAIDDSASNIFAVGRIYKPSNSLEGIITRWNTNGGCDAQRTISTSNSDELYSVNLNGSNHISCAGTIATPDAGYSQAVLKVLKSMNSIPDGVLSGYGMTHVNIGTSTMTLANTITPVVTSLTITLSTVTYSMADRSLIKTGSDFYTMFSSL